MGGSRMAGFWHFLPGLRQSDLLGPDRTVRTEIIERVGLAGVLADARRHPDDLIITPLDRGPEGQQGLLLYPVPPRGDLPKNPSYDPDTQRFERRGPRWIGWLPENPPTPLDLERRVLINGYFIADECNNQWVIPTARGKDHDLGGLPFELVFGDDDEPQAKVSGKFSKFWNDAKRVYDHLNDVAVESTAWLGRTAATALAVNYRIGDQELACLSLMERGLFQADFLLHALMSIVDFNAPADYLTLKKKLTYQTPVAG